MKTVAHSIPPLRRLLVRLNQFCRRSSLLERVSEHPNSETVKEQFMFAMHEADDRIQCSSPAWPKPDLVTAGASQHPIFPGRFGRERCLLWGSGGDNGRLRPQRISGCMTLGFELQSYLLSRKPAEIYVHPLPLCRVNILLP